MSARSKKNEVNRREFLSKTGTGLLVATIPASTAWASRLEPSTLASSSASRRTPAPGGAKKKIPIGVFDPVYNHLSVDEMLDKVTALGLEAMEIGTGGYPNNPHCPLTI
jgi:hypothetical protein